MLKYRYLFFFANFVEIVHIELSHERRKLFMFEIFWQNLVLKEFFVAYNEAITTLHPVNNVTIASVLQNFVSLHDEVRNLLFAMNSSSTGCLGCILACH